MLLLFGELGYLLRIRPNATLSLTISSLAAIPVRAPPIAPGVQSHTWEGGEGMVVEWVEDWTHENDLDPVAENYMYSNGTLTDKGLDAFRREYASFLKAGDGEARANVSSLCYLMIAVLMRPLLKTTSVGIGSQ